MASNSGKAIDAPTPRNTVRRERCFLVMNIALSSNGAAATYRADGTGVRIA
jgi:hypothetical protein